MRKLIVASSLLLAAAAVADEGVRIPEPMVFDLTGLQFNENDSIMMMFGFPFIYATP